MGPRIQQVRQPSALWFMSWNLCHSLYVHKIIGPQWLNHKNESSPSVQNVTVRHFTGVRRGGARECFSAAALFRSDSISNQTAKWPSAALYISMHCADTVSLLLVAHGTMRSGIISLPILFILCWDEDDRQCCWQTLLPKTKCWLKGWTRLVEESTHFSNNSSSSATYSAPRSKASWNVTLTQ